MTVTGRVVEVTPNVTRQIVAIPVKPNVPVKANDVLFQIDPAPFQYKVSQSQASIAAAKQVDSLSRTLDCIKTMCATEPIGPIRDKLETERANLVIGLFVARAAAMRISSSEPAPDVSANSNLSLVRRG